MNIFDQFIKLSCSIEIIVPSTIDVDKPIDNAEYVNKTMDFLIEKFGGATAQNPAIGGWQSSQGFKIKEGITSVISYMNETDYEDKKLDCVKFIHFLKLELKQEAMFAKFNGVAYLI